ncbi:hypothetical protein OIV83_005762 [Microbotryomycetes sp. JL201]|nr:hypothetical protein OIV83_005762 [Microbotryomycetes sp. JL201]
MATNGPLLGTPYIISQSPTSHDPQTTITTAITPTLCQNLSAFKSLLRNSRALDDSIILRLNRAAALARGNNGTTSGGGGGVGHGECDVFWNELVARWKERGEMLKFCDASVAQGIEANQLPVETGLDREATLKGRGESERDVKRRQIHNEIDVEEIVRARSLQFFASRCPSHPQQPSVPDLPKTGIPDRDEPGSGRRGRDARGGVRWNG